MVGLPDDYKPQKNNASFKTQSEFGVDAYRDQAASKFGESRSEPPNAGFLYSPRTRKDLEAQRMRTQNIEVDEDARKAKAAAAAKKKALAATLKMSRTAAEIERDLKLKKVFDIARDEDDVEDESSQWLSNASRANSSPFFTSRSVSVFLLTLLIGLTVQIHEALSRPTHQRGVRVPRDLLATEARLSVTRE